MTTEQKAIHTNTIADPNALALYSCLLFLDFDGVLHGFSNGDKGIFQFVPVLEKLLLDHPHVGVVFSTSWRFSWTMPMLIDQFHFDLWPRFVGVTPCVQEKWPPYVKHERYKECLKFMEENGYTGKWVAVDDADNLFPEECENLVLTEGNKGISDQNVNDLIRHFGVLPA